KEQALVYDDLLENKAVHLAQAVHDGAAILAVCGGYQLLGHYYDTAQGERFPGIGLLDVRTEPGKTRCIGDVVVEPDSGLGLEPRAPGRQPGAGRPPSNQVPGTGPPLVPSPLAGDGRERGPNGYAPTPPQPPGPAAPLAAPGRSTPRGGCSSPCGGRRGCRRGRPRCAWAPGPGGSRRGERPAPSPSDRRWGAPAPAA